MNDALKCPNCLATPDKCIPGVAWLSTEQYGERIHNVKCLTCGFLVKVVMRRKVELVAMDISWETEADW